MKINKNKKSFSKIILFGVILLLAFTSVNAQHEILGILTDNEILNLDNNNLNLGITYNSYLIEEEMVFFYFNINDYDRALDENEVIRNYRIKRPFETFLPTDVLSYCVNNNDCNRFIYSEGEIELYGNMRVTPIKRQLLDEIERIKDKIEGYKTEIRRDRNPIINFIESFNFNIF